MSDIFDLSKVERVFQQIVDQVIEVPTTNLDRMLEDVAKTEALKSKEREMLNTLLADFLNQ